VHASNAQPSDPDNTLRMLSAASSSDMEDFRLYGKTHCGGSDKDILEIEFFGLCDPTSQTLVYRTKNGLQVFASDGNPAALEIETRPIESVVSSPLAFERVSTWLQECKETHTICEKNSGTIPIRLLEISTVKNEIDTIRIRNTLDLGRVEYATLSYCWGGDQLVKCLRSPITSLMAGISISRLPQSISDAVSVCQALSIGFLWVDALCIIPGRLSGSSNGNIKNG
jgi:Heterokaryon incompatibility protein (HET)